MNNFIQAISQADTIAISGHRRPDGDCVGACMGLYHYIKENFPNKKEVTVYLEPISPKFTFLKDSKKIVSEVKVHDAFDLFICLDCGDYDRLNEFAPYCKKAKKVFCVDHHISNEGFGDEWVILPEASSTCEILFHLFEYEKISLDCANALYLGIVHDTGVFKHSNTTRKVMHVAGDLIAKGINTSRIIDDTFYRKNYVQNLILGRALTESELLCDGQIIYSMLTMDVMKLYGVTGSDLDGIIDQLRITEGVECAILVYEMGVNKYKVSMRSNEKINVSEIAQHYKGGGHVRAAGCTMYATNPSDIKKHLMKHMEKQLGINPMDSGE